MNISDKNIIGEVVANDYRTAAVFTKYAIDFCCQGNRRIEEACEEQDVNIENLIHDLNEALQGSTDKSIDFKTWPLDLLADYIEKTHHSYCEQKITEIKPYLEKITNVHGPQHPELSEIKELFGQTASEMSAHMKKEELILFPFIKKMVKTEESGEELIPPKFGSVENPIDIMMDDHMEEGERFRKIRALSKDYSLPEDGCNTYAVTMKMLEEFETDLFQHIHLENNILFPKALELEKKLA